MRLKLISCEIFYREMCYAVSQSPNLIEIEFLPKGLHDIGSAGMLQRVQEVLDKVDEIHKRNKQVIIVGGSLFYIKSLFYPPIEFPLLHNDRVQEVSVGISPWNLLQQIDPVRAASLHPNDTYRVARALKIWHQTGTLPSKTIPVYSPPFPSNLVFINLERELLYQRIDQRAVEMVIRQVGLTKQKH